MRDTHLATYLKDHLAGATAGLELIDHITRLHADEPTGPFASQLRAEIADDLSALKDLMARLHVTPSPARTATSWASAKFAELKVHLDDLHDGGLRRFELWEAMSLGIEGKRLLWRRWPRRWRAAPSSTAWTSGRSSGRPSRSAGRSRPGGLRPPGRRSAPGIRPPGHDRRHETRAASPANPGGAPVDGR